MKAVNITLQFTTDNRFVNWLPAIDIDKLGLCVSWLWLWIDINIYDPDDEPIIEID